MTFEPWQPEAFVGSYAWAGSVPRATLVRIIRNPSRHIPADGYSMVLARLVAVDTVEDYFKRIGVTTHERR